MRKLLMLVLLALLLLSCKLLEPRFPQCVVAVEQLGSTSVFSFQPIRILPGSYDLLRIVERSSYSCSGEDCSLLDSMSIAVIQYNDIEAYVLPEWCSSGENDE